MSVFLSHNSSDKPFVRAIYRYLSSSGMRVLDTLQAEVDALKRLQAETAAELDALLPAILDRAFKGEL